MQAKLKSPGQLQELLDVTRALLEVREFGFTSNIYDGEEQEARME